MKLQKLLSYVRRAVDDYSMIEEGDKIAVGKIGRSAFPAAKTASVFWSPSSIYSASIPSGLSWRQLPSPSVCQVQAMTAYKHSAMSWVCIIPLWKPISAKSFLMSEKKKIPALSAQKCGRAH